MTHLHYATVGEGPALLIIHGLLGSADNWRRFAKAYSQHYQVISVDCRNHGRSFHHPQQTYALMAEDIVKVLDTLAISKATILGHSMGGKVAMQFTKTYPERVDKLIVVDMALRTYRDTHSYLFKLLLSLDLSQFTTLKEVDEALSTSISSVTIRRFLLLNLQSTAEGLQWRINLQNLLCNYPGLLQAIHIEQPLMHQGAFIRGGDSDYVTDQDWLDLAEKFPNMQQITLDHAGHWVHVEQAEKFSEKITEILQDD